MAVIDPGDAKTRRYTLALAAVLATTVASQALAVPQAQPWESPADLAGMRIATSYPFLVARYLHEHGVAATPVVLNGSVEIAPRLGTADAICDAMLASFDNATFDGAPFDGCEVWTQDGMKCGYEGTLTTVLGVVVAIAQHRGWVAPLEPEWWPA